ncbi:T9SS type B sorting domain-containing protein [Nonlabens dokdonensis]|uniref:PKD domain-containing protein n=1 Tax=Nonlabens dokdonensis (strain DSM 17205 / KCTC 12402 / DSW-6) TaxID=592029 RepID=L7WDH5_NONDD|nr:T9SS type B sorting domain-containing protein [Nonlabens dokdonensis]AGC78149.1 PKD domain-containing protein [Nonlabens dokdonensis DSW-6]
MKKLLLLTFLFIPILTFAQLEAAWWFFGDNASVDFNSGAPMAAPAGSLATAEGCSAISDECGILQMYSDGTTVWDRNGNPMPNGTGLSGNSSSAQSAIIIPDLGASDRYFVITISQFAGLNYSIVDMSLRAGLGDVVPGRRDILIQQNTQEKVTATLSDDGTFYWILTFEDGGVYSAYPAAGGIILSSRGVDSTLPPTSTLTDDRGYIRLSPDGSKVANTSVTPAGTAYLAEFNNATGIVSNPIALTTSNNAIANFYGAEFSPNSELIYLNANSSPNGNGCNNAVNREILQYNINSGGGWNSTPFVFAANGAQNSERGALQLGIDGKIYHARACQPWLGVVRSPDAVGAAAGYTDDGLALNNNSREGLPPFITSFFEPSFSSFEAMSGGGGGTSRNQVNFCDQTPIQFEASTSDFCVTTTVSWNFGDGSPLVTTVNPIHTFPGPGVYTVTLTARNGGFRFIASSDITIYANPIANPVADVFLCDSDGDGIESRDLDLVETPQVLDMQTNPDFVVSYHLTQNAADNNVNPITLPYDFPIGTTPVYVRITNDENATSRLCFDSITFDVVVASGAGATRPTDLVNCDDDNNGFSVFDITSTEPEVLGGLPASAFTISYHTSAIDASTGASPIMNPATYTNATINTERIYIRLADNSPSGCTSTTEVDLFVWDTPTANTVMDIAVCDDLNDNSEDILLTDFDTEVLNGQTNPDYVITYHLTQAEADTGANDQVSPFNLTGTTTFFARIDNSNNEPCFDTTSFTVELNPVPVANPVATYRLCDDISNNNSEVFDLVSRNPEVLLGQVPADFNIEYFTTQAEADQGSVGGATPVSNMYSSGGQTMYVRIENNANRSCHSTTFFDIIVDDLPVEAPVVDLMLCDDDTNDGSEDINLSTRFDALIYNGQSMATFDVTYHATRADADAGTPVLTSPYTVVSGSNSIFARLTNPANTSCYAVTPINVILNEQAVANTVAEYRICDDSSNDSLEDFDLSTRNTDVLLGQNPANFTIEYFTSQADADLGSVGGATPLPTIYNSGSTTLFVRIETNSNSSCYDTEMFDIFVDALPRAGTPTDIIVCDDPSNDGTENVDLSQFDMTILDGQTNPSFNVTYHATQTDADNNASPLASPYTVTSATPNIFARIDNADNDTCYTTTTFRFVISPTPTANAVQDMITCDDPSNDGSEVFDLTMANAQVLAGQTPSDFTITYHTTSNGAMTGMGTDQITNDTAYASSTTTPETIFVRIEAVANPVCADTTSFTLTVSEQPTAGTAIDLVGCDDISNDGFEEFDFTSQDASIYNGQSTADFNVTYHTSQADADNDTGALSFPYTNVSRAQTIYARIENASNQDCYDVSTFRIEVFARPTIANQGPYTICAGVPETIDAGPGYSSYLWSTGEMTQTIDVSSGDDYTVTVTNSDGCDSTATITVVESDVAVIERIDVGQFEVNTNTLTAIVTGSGDYEFSLDNFVYQDSQRFTNLYPGFYTIYVRDKNGCGTVSMDAVIIGGPPYFTPNQDGYHDTWQVIAVSEIPDASIYIFDRYGKLLKQISATGPGWDGTYNGNPMPSSDYWYLVELTDGRSFKGHFALKR